MIRVTMEFDDVSWDMEDIARRVRGSSAFNAAIRVDVESVPSGIEMKSLPHLPSGRWSGIKS